MKQSFTITEELNGVEKTLIAEIDLENIEQAKGFAEAYRVYALSTLNVKNDDGTTLASKVFEWFAPTPKQ